MVSVLIPIERFSFFVTACTRNILLTSGLPENQLDIVFLVSKQTTKWVLDAIERSRCRSLLIDVPIVTDKSRGLEHQIMLDTAMRDNSLSEWVVVQHCDLIWQKEGWLKELLRRHPKKTALPHLQYTKHFVHGKQVPLVGDFFGFFNRTKFREDFSFRCGYYGDEWVDGSVLLSLELAKLNEIEEPLDLSGHFYHLMAFFRIYESISVNGRAFRSKLPLGDAFGLPKELWIKAFTAYSYLTSFAIEKQEIGDKVLPWSLFSELADQDVVKICDDFIEKKLDLNKTHVDEIIFADKVCFSKKIKL